MQDGILRPVQNRRGVSFWSHRSDAATRDRIELSFAAVHESLVGTKRTCRDVRHESVTRSKADIGGPG